jgi:hypothetical protein
MRTSTFLLGLVLIAGCGGPKLASVSGTVTLDGQPLANASVTFQPMGEGNLNPGQGSYAKTDQNGNYTLEMQGGKKGAVVAKHKVEISAVTGGAGRPDDDRPQRQQRDRVPAQYNTQSKLTVEVKPGENVGNFDLKSRP